MSNLNETHPNPAAWDSPQQYKARKMSKPVIRTRNHYRANEGGHWTAKSITMHLGEEFVAGDRRWEHGTSEACAAHIPEILAAQAAVADYLKSLPPTPLGCVPCYQRDASPSPRWSVLAVGYLFWVPQELVTVENLTCLLPGRTEPLKGQRAWVPADAADYFVEGKRARQCPTYYEPWGNRKPQLSKLIVAAVQAESDAATVAAGLEAFGTLVKGAQA